MASDRSLSGIVLLLALAVSFGVPQPAEARRKPQEPVKPSPARPAIAKTVKPEAGRAPKLRRKFVFVRPDLVVSAVRVERRSCELDRIGLRLRNIGKGGVPETAWDAAQGAFIQVSLDGRPWGRLKLKDADPEQMLRRPGLQTRPHVVRLPPRQLEIGTHRVIVTVDSNNSVAELNERNNTSGVRIHCAVKPDAVTPLTRPQGGLPKYPWPKRPVRKPGPTSGAR